MHRGHAVVINMPVSIWSSWPKKAMNIIMLVNAHDAFLSGDTSTLFLSPPHLTSHSHVTSCVEGVSLE